MASLVGGALQWRPHLLLTAPAAQGKTWLLTNVLEPIMGNMMTSVSDATPASISRLTAYSSLPVAIDEAEPSDDWVVELLKTLRAASSDFGSRSAGNGGRRRIVSAGPVLRVAGGHGCAGVGKSG